MKCDGRGRLGQRYDFLELFTAIDRQILVKQFLEIQGPFTS